MSNASASVRGLARLGRWQLAALAISAILVVAGKQAYRAASPDELAWILAPTARLVSLVTGSHFVAEAGVGWIDRDATFVIAPACAGVHFLITAFVVLVLGWLAAMRTARTTTSRLAGALGLAYAATLVVNTLRIAIALALHRGALDLGDLDRGEVHRLEGVIVYLASLCALHALASRRRSHA